MPRSPSTQFVFLPLGGVGEIGMNLAMYGFGPEDNREWIVVDMGVSFAGPEHPGADLILPDIRFLEAEKNNLRGIIITHAHEDHYGALLDLWPRLKAPVYATPFTAGLLEAKRQSEFGAPEIPITIFKAGESFEVGPFKLEAIAVTHSIPEPVSLAITTPLGTVVHTGDWKMDPDPSMGPLIDEARFRAIGDRGVLALICDSTNAMREGESPSEREVGDSLRELIENARGRVAVTTFSSNVGRIRSITEAARDAGRQVLVVGRSMKRTIAVATELGYMEGLPEFLSEDDYGYIPRENVVMILTGSQGEPRAALAKLARDEMRSIALSAGDTVIFSSRPIPGNEKAILDIKNKLIDQGIKLISDDDALVHVSGHPRRSELKRMYSWVRPRILVPVHGEAAHLVAQGSLGAMEGIEEIAQVRDGDMLRLAPGKAEIIDEAPVGRIYKDGKLIGDEDEIGMVERRKLAFVGHVAVSVLLDRDFKIMDEPDLVAFGLPEEDGQGDLMEDILLDAAIEAIDSIPRARRKDLEVVRESVRRAVRSATNEAWGKKPVVTVFINRIK
ncbi:ribonuclease J [Brucella pituitosa]|uniref:Ribonuclease J n=3 Tax=Brucella pituitosa TaxID=571256 RepID=A0A643F609_9HYPH|nr:MULTISPECIES: ribonuclease J [Brucella]PQZ52096.1 MBL fold metallo-hydrolase [Ochrobactrum sp. MYb19]PRA53912.1 MBL fold metallo-hydrolase [Ochrobactrum sp. MYb68]PRA62787.1 MBL fold metallo-hydrolase [Ochrobactrum sp. MYb18]PRA76560.1 MBL fold metallo-hydrolase [Brucella thiophenivorans]PRA87109.1 MBL fold metallo-hydrolase [Ochrobactrum sp. MYb29]PRA93807.1 MBL fold metallo-hydrolase [Ochrobactrum sp. MYb14]PRA98567.1 MBL fold metallo-hydrolase [Ochrobactrum sp. MYb15]